VLLWWSVGRKNGSHTGVDTAYEFLEMLKDWAGDRWEGLFVNRPEKSRTFVALEGLEMRPSF